MEGIIATEKDYNACLKTPIYNGFKPWLDRHGNGTATEWAHRIECRAHSQTGEIVEKIEVLKGEDITYINNQPPNNFVTVDWKLERTVYIHSGTAIRR